MQQHKSLLHRMPGTCREIFTIVYNILNSDLFQISYCLNQTCNPQANARSLYILYSRSEVARSNENSNAAAGSLTVTNQNHCIIPINILKFDNHWLTGNKFIERTRVCGFQGNYGKVNEVKLNLCIVLFEACKNIAASFKNISSLKQKSLIRQYFVYGQTD